MLRNLDHSAKALGRNEPLIRELEPSPSDYPHPEGSRDPIGKLEASLDASGIGTSA